MRKSSHLLTNDNNSCYIPYIHHRRKVRGKVKNRQDKKLLALAEKQEKPLFRVKNTVVLHNLDAEPPKICHRYPLACSKKCSVGKVQPT